VYQRFFRAGVVLAFVLIVMVGASISTLCAQQAPGVTPQGAPQVMRFCSDKCQTLTWKGDHYDGVVDGESQTNFLYYVELWSASGIRLKGHSLLSYGVPQQHVVFGTPVQNTKKVYIESEFTGVIDANGHSVDEGVQKWRMGNKSGEMAFRLTWSGAPSCSASASGSAETTPMPVALSECDGDCITKQSGNVGTLVFQGSKGTGTWTRERQRATLIIQRWDSEKAIIVREDTADSSMAGLTAVYEGKLCGDRIEGNLTVRYPGHFDGLVVPFMATIPLTSCDSIGDDPVRLKDVGKDAMRFRQLPSAFKCFLHASKLGTWKPGRQRA
jgi:hypothetical protein